MFSFGNVSTDPLVVALQEEIAYLRAENTRLAGALVALTDLRAHAMTSLVRPAAPIPPRQEIHPGETAKQEEIPKTQPIDWTHPMARMRSTIVGSGDLRGKEPQELEASFRMPKEATDVR